MAMFFHPFMAHHGLHLMTSKTGVITHGELSIDDVVKIVKLPSHYGHNGINLIGDVNGKDGNTNKTYSN